MPAIGVHVCEGCGVIYDTIGPYLDCQGRHQRDACPFCQIVNGTAPATIVREWDDALVIVPLKPVVDGHLLVIPKTHVCDFTDDPEVSAATMRRAAELCGAGACNLITSRGRAASQSVFHLHLHLIPRAENDGLALPWYSGKHSRKAAS